MDYLRQYLRLVEVKPVYYELTIPYFRSSQRRFTFNVEELELWRAKEFGVLRPGDAEKPIKGGGGNGEEPSSVQKIICLEF
jgi:hypothetical protein